MRKKTRGKKFYGIIIAGVVCLIAFIGYRMIGMNQGNFVEEENQFAVTKIQEPDPLVFKGTVEPKEVRYYYVDQTRGKMQSLAIKDGQKIEKDEIVATYQNDTAESTRNEQSTSLDRFQLAVASANENYQLAIKKRQQAYSALSNAKNKRAAAQKNQAENGAELDGLVTQAQQDVDAQESAVVQARQALEAANVDLNAANQTLEQAKEKVVTHETAELAGYVYVNEQGKTDASVPYATIVSPETVIKGTITEYDYPKVKINQAISIETNADKKVMPGTITQISNLPVTNTTKAAEASTTKSGVATYSFTATVAENLHYGYTVQVTVPKENVEIPTSALLEKNGKNFVFVVQNGKAKKQNVEVERQGATAKVLKGVGVGTKILTNPGSKVKEGQEVAVKE